MTYKHTETEEDTYNIIMRGTYFSMAFFFIILIAISCATIKEPLRAKVLKIKEVPSGYEITYRRARNYYTSICSSKPAFEVGDYVKIN